MGIITMGIPKEITLALASLNDSSVFIETGTYMGETTRWASNHFESVHTIERAEKLYNSCSSELSTIRGVNPHLGDSRNLLPEILHEVGNQTIVFWLDGHWSGGETAGERDECPLIGELACLSDRYEDIILIDDARLFLCAPPLPHNSSQWPTMAEIICSLPSSGKKHFVQVVDDVIFVIPKKKVLQDYLVDHARQRSSLFWKEWLLKNN